MSRIDGRTGFACSRIKCHRPYYILVVGSLNQYRPYIIPQLVPKPVIRWYLKRYTISLNILNGCKIELTVSNAVPLVLSDLANAMFRTFVSLPPGFKPWQCSRKAFGKTLRTSSIVVAKATLFFFKYFSENFLTACSYISTIHWIKDQCIISYLLIFRSKGK